MELDRVRDEIQQKGEYWRGDSRVWVKDGTVYCEYLPKDGYSSTELLKGSNIQRKENVQVTVVDNLLRIHTTKKDLKDLIDLINSIEYQDIHIVKRAGCNITIRDQNVVDIGEPRLLYCPMAHERYGRKACTRCSEVKPYLEKEFAEKIAGGMFTKDRRISEKRARYTYGASEMLMDALREHVIDAAVVVCDGIGTVIVDRPDLVQGIGERMTGLFYTSPHKELIKRAEASSFVVFPETARIDQVSGVEAARRLGYQKIAVTTADHASKDIERIKEIDKEITSLALCTTGIDQETTTIIQRYADLVWACGSQRIRETVGPAAWIQLGTRLPVFVLTPRGFDLAKPRIIREFGRYYPNLALDPKKHYHNCKEVKALPIRSEDEPYPLL